tara:strand:+ start:15539 stop:17326 length:1788 start_codon:yes stop_codon:yes gene_type:complete
MKNKKYYLLIGILMGQILGQQSFAATTVSASTNDGNDPMNTIDGNLATRWSAKGDGQWIKFDLGSKQKVDDIDIAFYKGNERYAYFDIELSSNDSSWKQVYTGMSAKNSKLQNFNIADQTARYVRIVGHGNSANTWNSLTEVNINTLSDGSGDNGSPSNTNEADTILSKTTMVMQKQNTSFAIDGNNGAIQGQQIYLWNTNQDNANQQWIERKLSNNYYAYAKINTTLCLDGGDGAARRQAVTLQECDNSDKNQHWRKVNISNGSFRLEKRDTAFSIDGNGGATRRQAIYLWNSSNTNANQQWQFLIDGSVTVDPEVPDNNIDPVGNLDPSLPPGQNFDLGQWKITFPDATEQTVEWLIDGGKRSNEFYTDPKTGGMVFRCPNSGATTSNKTKYPRSELREMLRGTNDDISTKGVNGNNWVLSTSNSTSVKNAGGIDGRLSATLSVDHVSTSGDSAMVGRVVVGQIHGSEDEPLKIYYRKLPNNSKGSIYFTYEKWQGSDVKYNLIGNSDDDAPNPSKGIRLGEKWSYDVDVYGQSMTVTVTKEDGSKYDETITLEGDYKNDWMFFKAGVYNQNNGGDAGDYAQATFYKLTQSHD